MYNKKVKMTPEYIASCDRKSNIDYVEKLTINTFTFLEPLIFLTNFNIFDRKIECRLCIDFYFVDFK